MQIRIVRIQLKNPLVAIGLIAIVLAVLVVFLTAAMALVAGAALVGGVGIVASRLRRGRHDVRVGSGILAGLDPADEIRALPTASPVHDEPGAIVARRPDSAAS